MEQYRVHIGGLSQQITQEEELVSKFGSFGKVKDCEIIKDTQTGWNKGYAFLTLIAEAKNWQKCLTILNGTRWKGSTLNISLAKASFIKTLENERKGLLVEENGKPQRRRLGSHECKDMSLIKDDMSEIRKGWKKVRYGRLVCELKVRKLNGTLIGIDPEKNPHQIKSFKKKDKELNEVIENVPLNTLSWSIEDKIENTYDATKTALAKDEIARMKQAESVAKKNEMLNRQKEQMKLALSNIDREKSDNPNLIRFESESEGEDQFKKVDQNTKVDDLFGDSESEEGVEDNIKNGKDFLFSDDDGDEEDNFDNIGIKAVFEGEEGQKRLQMQKGFGNDSRFKLDDQFIDSDEEVPEVKNTDVPEDDIKTSLEEEKGKTLDLLKGLFNLPTELKITDQAKNEAKKGNSGLEWKAMLRYDPDASDAEELEVDPTKLAPTNQQRKINKDLDIKSKEDKLNSKKSTPLPQISKEKHFEVSDKIENIFSKDLSKRDQGTFSLFGTMPELSEESEEEEYIEPIQKKELFTSQGPIIESQADLNMEKEPSFFFHLDAQWMNTPRFEGEKIFMRTENINKLERELNKNRKQLINYYKSRHRMANTQKKIRVERFKK